MSGVFIPVATHTKTRDTEEEEVKEGGLNTKVKKDAAITGSEINFSKVTPSKTRLSKTTPSKATPLTAKDTSSKLPKLVGKTQIINLESDEDDEAPELIYAFIPSSRALSKRKASPGPL